MKLVDFLLSLKEKGIELKLEGSDQLRLKARKGAMTPEIRETLKARKPEIIQFLQQSRSAIGKTRETIQKAPEGQPLVLSFAQERQWFLDRLEPNSTAYNVPFAIRLNGDLNKNILKQAFALLVARHESLRTRFEEHEGEAVQIVEDQAQLCLMEEDISQIAPAEREAAAHALIQKEMHHCFSLGTGPLFRVLLIGLSQSEFILLLNHHHIITDGWSIGILTGEFGRLYTSLVKGVPPALPPLPLQYRDYAYWQRSKEGLQRLQDGLNTWEALLQGAPTHLELPTDFARPPVQTMVGNQLDFEIPQRLTAAVDALGSQLGATRAMVTMSALALLLSRYANQDEICLGMPVANRPQQELEGLIGFFVNTLVIRVAVPQKRTACFVDLVKSTREFTLKALDIGEVPFEQVVERCQPERDLSRSPMFQVLFNEVKETMVSGEDGAQLPGLTLSPFDLSHDQAKYELSLAVSSGATAMQVSLTYNSDLFNGRSMETLIGHYLHLLTSATEEPNRPLPQNAMMNPAEKFLLLTTWNQTAQAHTGPNLLHQRFEALAGGHPEKKALVWGDCSVSYGALNEKANRLAHRLAGWGIGPEMCVGIAMNRCPDMVAAQMAVLKTGGLYVPLDPAYPPRRLAFMMEDAQVKALVSQSHLRPQLPESEAPCFCFDTQEETLGRFSADNPAARAQDRNPAYLIYTSGSTGRPKGVTITHSSATAMVQWTQTVYRDEDLEATLAATSINFDLSIYEIFVTLSRGGTLVLVDDILALADVAYPVKLINTVPSAARELVAAGTIPKTVRIVNLAGEALPGELVRALYALPHIQAVFNLYGPSEDTTYSTVKRIPADLEGNPTIGEPIANTQAYLLDAHGALTARGVPGEICLAGRGLARGYFNKPAMTAEKFIPNPFADRENAGSRLYRCGDLARHHAQAPPDRMDLVFMGRIDRQVKLRGFRLEIGEIEAVIRGHAAVNEAAVKLWHTQDAYLAAYLTGSGELDTQEITAWLKERLPGYMVPAQWVVLDALPMTPNGKTDYKTLPEPQTKSQTDYVAPTTPEEKLLAVIWMDILKIDRVGANDNFFALGGHSLLGTRILAQIQKTFSVQLPLKILFEKPTLRELALAIAQARREGRSEETQISVRPQQLTHLPLSFGQERLWFLDRLEPGSSAYNMPLSFRLCGPLNRAFVHAALTEIQARHEVLRTVYLEHEGKPRQVVQPPSPLPFHFVSQAQLGPDEQQTRLAELMREAADFSFDLQQGPVMIANLWECGQAEHILMVNIHHIAADGWSTTLLMDEFCELYLAQNNEEPADLEALPIQYADYALWQRQWLRGETLEKQMSFWERELAGCSHHLDLPVDHKRPALQSGNGADFHFLFDQDLSQDLEQLAPRLGLTHFMLNLAIFSVFLGRICYCRDLNIGTPIANRNRSQIEKLIGFFVNTLVLRLQPVQNLTFEEFLIQCRTHCLDAFSHQDLPFELLVERLQPERDTSITPLFQVMFSMDAQTKGREPSQLGNTGLEIEPVVMPQTQAKFDLSLDLVRTADQLQGTFNYNTDLFEEKTIARFAQTLQVLSRALLKNRSIPIGHISMLSEQERGQLLQFNNRNTADQNITDYATTFEQRLAQFPDRIAVSTHGETWTYTQLNTRANEIAQGLHQRGVRSDDVVGVCLHRSNRLIATILAVFKCGGVWLPLDKEAPIARLQDMIEDAAPKLLISEKPALYALLEPLSPRVPLHDLSEIPGTGTGQNNFSRKRGANQLAYIIFTSGTTGRPRGVGISHKSFLNHNLAAISGYGLTAQDCVLQFCSLHFDASVEEIFPTLLVGAHLVMYRREKVITFDELSRLTTSLGITVLDLPTAYWHEWVYEMERTGEKLPDSLRLLIVGGEAADPKCLSLWQEAKNTVTWVNTYGPTEATVIATWFPVKPGDGVPEILPIGVPLPNYRIYLVDQQCRLVGLGHEGEIMIAGPGLARGYLNKPANTALKFVPDPFTQEPGSRMYKTGDKARYRDDGRILFMGRVDFQVKIRGFRIEPAEIAHLLMKHPQVSQAIVVAHGKEPRLAAYVVPQDSPPGAGELGTFLRERLAEYMIPDSFTLLEQLPLTPTGKVDRRALPEPIIDREERGAPRDRLEMELLGIWETLLPETALGVHDNFFQVGGHSLLSVRLISLINQRFGISLPVAALFEAPTIAGQAQLIRNREKPAFSPITPIKPLGEQTPLFLVHPVGGNVMCYVPLAGKLTGHPVYAFSAQGLEGDTAPLTSIQAMAQTYLSHLKQQKKGPYLIGGWSMGGVIALEMARALKAANHDVTLVLIDTYLASGPQPGPAEEAGMFARDLGGLFNQMPQPAPSLSETSDQDRDLQALWDWGQQHQLFPDDLSKEQLTTMFRVYQANARAHHEYRPRPYDGPVYLFEADQRQGRPSPLNHWQPLLPKIKTIPCKGNHYSLIQPPDLNPMAEEILAVLDHATRPFSSE